MKSVLDVKLNVKPVFATFEHQYYYEGPCRMAGGEALQPGFDGMVNGQIVKGTMAALDAMDKDYVNILEPSVIVLTDDWDLKPGYLDPLLEDDDKTDVYMMYCGFGADIALEEFADRTSKPICPTPDTSFGVILSAHAYRLGADIIRCIDWPEVEHKFRVLRAQKTVREANILCVTRFDSTHAKAGGVDTFNSLRQATDVLGTHFRFMNVHEFIDQMKPLPEGGNYTTPGRKTPNITEEELKELSDKADGLMSSAEPCEIDKDHVMKSLAAWKVAQKNMEANGCMGFVAPCPDMCSTRRINQEQFTLCFAHSLNLEEGIASACEYDVTAAVCQMIEMSLTDNAAYMGNTLPVVKTNGETVWPTWINQDEVSGIENTDNLYTMYHSTPCRKYCGIKKDPAKFGLRHFAYDQKFGAIMRYNFSKDAGQKITLMRISADLKEMLIVNGEIVAANKFDSDNCNGGVIFRVSDTDKVFHEHARFGLHLVMVYGDIADDLEMLAGRWGMKAVRL